MSSQLDQNVSYSAQVRLWLEVGDRKIPLTHAGPHYVIAKEALDLPMSEATVVMTVDGERVARRVHLPNGMSPDVSETEVVTLKQLVAR